MASTDRMKRHRTCLRRTIPRRFAPQTTDHPDAAARSLGSAKVAAYNTLPEKGPPPAAESAGNPSQVVISGDSAPALNTLTRPSLPKKKTLSPAPSGVAQVLPSSRSANCSSPDSRSRP